MDYQVFDIDESLDYFMNYIMYLTKIQNIDTTFIKDLLEIDLIICENRINEWITFK